MRFGKDHKAIISSLEGDEVEAYCDFLDSEILRHIEAIKECKNIKAMLRGIGTNIRPIWLATMIELENSAIRRHKQDIKDIYACVRQAKMLKK